MRHIKLSEHIFKKGKFITPFNNLPMVKEFEDEKSWAYGRMPEYLWIGLILNHYGRDEGLRKSYNIISLLHKLAPNLYTARLSEILKLDTDVQEALFEYVVSIGAKEVLNPLTVFLTVSKTPTFAKYFYCPNVSASERCETLVCTMSRIADHQSNPVDISCYSQITNFVNHFYPWENRYRASRRPFIFINHCFTPFAVHPAWSSSSHRV